MYEDSSGKSWRDDPDGNESVRAIAYDFFVRWGPGGVKAFQPISQELRKLVKPLVSDDMLDTYSTPPKDKKRKRASRSLRK